MNNSQGRNHFTETLWNMDEKALIQRFIVGTRQGDAQTALAILQAKSTLAAEAAAAQSNRMATATFLLAALTGLMAVATFWVALRS